MAVMLISGRKDEDQAADIIDIPKRTTPAKGKERPKFECAVCIIQQRETVKEICICPESCGFFCIYSCCLYLLLITFAPCPAISLGLVPCRLRAVVPARGGPHLHLSAEGVQEPHRARSLGWSRSEPVCWTLDCKNRYPLFSCSISQHRRYRTKHS